MILRRVVYVLGLAILLVLIGALVIGINQEAMVFGQGRLNLTTSKLGLLVFLLILAPFAMVAALKNWR